MKHFYTYIRSKHVAKFRSLPLDGFSFESLIRWSSERLTAGGCVPCSKGEEINSSWSGNELNFHRTNFVNHKTEKKRSMQRCYTCFSFTTRLLPALRCVFIHIRVRYILGLRTSHSYKKYWSNSKKHDMSKFYLNLKLSYINFFTIWLLHEPSTTSTLHRINPWSCTI